MMRPPIGFGRPFYDGRGPEPFFFASSLSVNTRIRGMQVANKVNLGFVYKALQGGPPYLCLLVLSSMLVFFHHEQVLVVINQLCYLGVPH